MSKFHLVLGFLAIALTACDPTPSDGQGGGMNVSAVALQDVPIKVDWRIPNDPMCLEPQPDDIGCTTLCKPCLTFQCEDGEWVGINIDPPDFVCNPDFPGSGDDLTACPRQSGLVLFSAAGDDFSGGQDEIPGFCPAECSFCY